ncbi:high-affinity nickel-transport protein-domain-containing protein [Aspergillus aurantiobrunneus]
MPLQSDDKKWTTLVRHAQRSHSRLPGLRKIPLRSIAIILLVAAVNVVVWVAVAIVLLICSSLLSNAVLAYTLGLRHAFDADHISAIDLMTRRLLATGQKPVTVGTFFSLGHSTIVIITSIVVAATAAAVSSRFDRFSTVGGIIGTSVSAAFLILLGVMNAYILYKLYKQLQKVLDLPEGREDEAWRIEGGGILFGVLKRLFRVVDRPWKMYPLGVLFGLGFDTSSEIALLGISSIEAAKGTTFWVILIFPILFTAGMCLLDTTDGALMLALYIQPATNFLSQKESQSPSPSSTTQTPLIDPETPNPTPDRNPDTDTTQNHRDPIAFLYYSIVLTTLTVTVAIVIGAIQLLTLILNVAEPTGPFWDGVQTAGDYYDVIGGGICGAFLVVGVGSVFCYRPWRRWVSRRGKTKTGGGEQNEGEGEGEGETGSGAGRIIPRVDTPSPTHTPDPPGFNLSTCPSIFVLPTHLSLDALHQAEETLLQHGARLTYDVAEAPLILGKVGQKKRAALELRSRGVWTEEVNRAPTPHPLVPAKRRRVELEKDATEEVYLGTEDESEEDGVRGRRPAAHLEHPQLSTSTSTGTVSGSTSSATQLLGGAQDGVISVVRLEWLARCVEAQELTPIHPFVVYCARKVERPPTKRDLDTANSQAILDRAKQDAAFKVPLPSSSSTAKSRQHGLSSSQRAPPKLYRQTTSENEEAEPLPPEPEWVHDQVLYACMRSSVLDPPNERFVQQLVKIRTIRELNLDEIGVRAYSTAIAAIAAYPYEIRRPSQVLSLPGCDHKIANLFAEFKSSESGTLAAAETLDKDPNLVILHQFYNIWGVGPKTARDFYYARQWRDLDDVVEHGWNTLSRVQQIGVKYYDEFLLDIPRAEVESIARNICRHANSVRPNATYDGRGVECIIVGSYRRGKPVSHDVDLILTHRDESITHNLVVDVVASLESEHWITHTLALHLTTSHRNQQPLPYRGDSDGKNHFDSLDKALVVWQDPAPQTQPTIQNLDAEGRKNTNPHRRVDIIISPWRTVGCAVLGWTGDTTFERDLRRYAKKSRGWKFDSSGVRERTTGGQVIDLEGAGETWEERERLVMEGLGVGWRPAGERCTR